MAQNRQATDEERALAGLPPLGSLSTAPRQQSVGRRQATDEERALAGLPPLGGPSAQTVEEDERLSGIESAIATGLRVIPAVGGGLLGAFAGPLGAAGVGSIGAMLGEGWAQRYEADKLEQEYDPNITQLAIAGASGLMPWGSVGRVGGSALRSALPKQLAQRLPSMRAAPAGVLERLRHQAVREVGKGASAGAPIAAIEGGASRYFQDQEVFDPEAIQRDLTMGALFGGAVPAAGAAATKGVGIVAPSRERGLGAWLHGYSNRHDANTIRKNARARAEGWAETETTGVTASKLGVGGTIDNQLDELQKLYQQTDANLNEMLDQPGVRYIKIRDPEGVKDSLLNAIKRRDKAPGQDTIKDVAEFKRLLNRAIVGDRIDVKDAIKLKRILDHELTSNAFSGKSLGAEDEALMRISNRFRTDLKSQMPPIADVLDSQKRIIDLQKSLSEYTGSVKPEDLLSQGMGPGVLGGLGGFAAFGGGPLGVAAGAAAGAGTRVAMRSPRIRSRLGNAVNWAAGNQREVIPPVVDLPQRPPEPLQLGEGAIRTPPPADTSGPIPQYEETWTEWNARNGIPGPLLLANVGQRGQARPMPASPLDAKKPYVQGQEPSQIYLDENGEIIKQHIAPGGDLGPGAYDAAVIENRAVKPLTDIDMESGPGVKGATRAFKQAVLYNTRTVGGGRGQRGAVPVPPGIAPDVSKAGRGGEGGPSGQDVTDIRQTPTQYARTRVRSNDFDQEAAIEALRVAFPRTRIINVGTGSPAPMKVELPNDNFITVGSQAAADKFRRFLSRYLQN